MVEFSLIFRCTVRKNTIWLLTSQAQCKESDQPKIATGWAISNRAQLRCLPSVPGLCGKKKPRARGPLCCQDLTYAAHE